MTAHLGPAVRSAPGLGPSPPALTPALCPPPSCSSCSSVCRADLRVLVLLDAGFAASDPAVSPASSRRRFVSFGDRPRGPPLPRAPSALAHQALDAEVTGKSVLDLARAWHLREPQPVFGVWISTRHLDAVLDLGHQGAEALCAGALGCDWLVSSLRGGQGPLAQTVPAVERERGGWLCRRGGTGLAQGTRRSHANGLGRRGGRPSARPGALWEAGGGGLLPRPATVSTAHFPQRTRVVLTSPARVTH